MQPLTAVQSDFVANLKMANTDSRAISIIEAAFNVRNARAIGLEIRDLRETCDKVAG